MRAAKIIGLLTLCVTAVAVTACGPAPSRTEVPTGEQTPSPTLVGGGTPDPSAVLLEASFAGQAEVVRQALERGADPNAVGEDGRTALMLAAFGSHTEILRLLLDGHARANVLDGSGRTALMYAATGPNAENVRLLLESKADPNVADREERFTALMFAAAEGHADVVRTLLEYGSDPDQVDVDGDTALDFATRNGHDAVVRVLGGGDHDAHWGYGRDDGPDRWSAINADWAICGAGTAQSPIDIRDAEEPSGVDPVAFNLPEASMRIIRQEHVLHALDNGHTIQVNVDAGETLTIGDQAFDLKQYHFHSPSEHTVNGEHYPMEMHLVHRSGAGELAVVGVFIEEGEHNAAFDTVWNNLPTEPGIETHIEHVQVNIDDMLPSDTTSWRYQGSLTTPPCTEGVRWIVLNTPIQLDAAQIERFKRAFSGNNRPTQPLIGRSIATASPVVE